MDHSICSLGEVDSGDARAVEFLNALIEQPDLSALECWLVDADVVDLDVAASWMRRRASQIEEFRPEESYDTDSDRRWIPTVICAAALTPAEAVKRLSWNDFWHARPHQSELLARTLLRRPRDWAERFVPRAARVRLGSRREPDTAPFLFWLLDRLVREHGLNVPDGDAFLDGWARSGSDLADPLYAKALLPPLLRSPHLRHRPDLPEAVPELATAGVSRNDVVDAVLEALTSPSTPASQRVLARLWVSLAIDADDLAGRLPLLVSALATCHGSVTRPLLPVTVELAGSGRDLDEIARTVAARPEKAQHVAFLRLLEERQLHERLGAAAVSGAAAHYDVVEDTALRVRASRLTRALGATPTEPDATEDAQGERRFDGLWSVMPRRRRVPAPLEIPARLSRSLIQQLLGDQWSRPFVAVRHGEINRVGEAVLLECLVRAASGGRLAALRTWLPASDATMWDGLQPVAGAIICWLRGDLEHPNLYDSRIPGEFIGNVELRWRGVPELLNAAAREVLSRAGRSTTVLSTPSHDDGTLSLEVLMRRVSSGAVTAYTPHDLALALFRLPPHPANTLDLGGLRLPVDLDVWRQHVKGEGLEAPDGMHLLRRWIEEGGLSPHAATYRLEESSSRKGAWRWDPMRPPYPAAVLDLLRIDHRAVLGTASLPDAVALAPGWPDLSATGDKWHWNNAAVLANGAGPLCTPGHAVHLQMMNGDTEEQTLAAIRLLELAAADRLSQHHLREAAEALNRAGMLPLSRFAHVVEQAFSSGGLSELWEPALGVANDAAVRHPRPSGLAELLRVLTAYAPAVPQPTLPQGLQDLATSRGSSKSHAEARALALACSAERDHHR